MSATFWNMRRRAAKKAQQQKCTPVDKSVDKPDEKPVDKPKRGRVKKDDV